MNLIKEYFADLWKIARVPRFRKTFVAHVKCDYPDCDWKEFYYSPKQLYEALRAYFNKPCPACKRKTPVDEKDFYAGIFMLRIARWFHPIKVAKVFFKFALYPEFRRMHRMSRALHGDDKVHVRVDSFALKDEKRKFVTITPIEEEEEKEEK